MKHLFFFFLFLSAQQFAQELDATVTVNYEKLPVINKESLVGFQNVISDYLNSTRFTGSNWDNPKIKCTFNIFFLSAGDEINYNAQVFIGSQREVYKSDKFSPVVTILDNNWAFTYEKNQSLYYNPSVFESIVSFLDYYAYIIIGMDADSWEVLGGTPYFTKAFEIALLGSNSRYSKGWERAGSSFSRRDLADDILSEKYRKLREGIADYYYGIDFYQVNKKGGQDKIAGFIKSIESIKSKIDIKSVFVKTFFDAKYAEIVDYMKDYEDKNIFKILKSIDPPHASKYDEMLR